MNVNDSLLFLDDEPLTQAISAMKYMPPTPPLVRYITDSSKDYNHLRGSLWQFRVQYEYKDGFKSAWSPISKLPMPSGGEDLLMKGQYYGVNENNAIKINHTIPFDITYVNKINIAVRKGNLGLFQLAESLEDFTRVIDYNFYNEKILIGIDVNDSNKLYDAVPKLAKAQEIIDGNRIAYGNVVDGFDKIDVDIDLNPVYEKQNPDEAFDMGLIFTDTGNTRDTQVFLPGTQYWATLTDDVANIYRQVFNSTSYYLTDTDNDVHGDDSIDRVEYQSLSLYKTPLNDLTRFKFEIIENPVEGDEITVKFKYVTKENISKYEKKDLEGNIINVPSSYVDERTFNYTHIVSSGETKLEILETIVNNINLSVGSDPVVKAKIIDDSIYVLCAFLDFRFLAGFRQKNRRDISNLKNYVFDYNSVVAIHKRLDSGAVQRCFKSGASHSIGIAYSDKSGRLSTVMGVKEVDIPYFTEINRRGIDPGPASMQVFIKHKPPVWAHYYHLVYSKNRNIGRFLQFVVKEYKPWAENSNIIALDLSLINDYQKEYPNTIISYDWSRGDRLRLLRKQNDDFYERFLDVEIVGYTDLNEILIYKEIDEFTLQNDIIVEIYSPLKDTDLDENIYYEIGESHPVANPGTNERYHDVVSNTDIQNFPQIGGAALINLYNEGDCYWRRRNIGLFSNPNNQPDTYDTFIEDPNFSDFYNSKDYNLGRPNIFQPDAKETRRPTTIYYSNPYIPDTNVNGLGNFYLESFEEYDQNYGSIQRLYSDKRLICFQELKVGQILVNEIIYRDLQGGASVGASESILSKMVYYAGEYGISTNPESFAVYGNRKYFTDVNRGAVLRLSTDGITPISENGMHNYFTDKFSAVDKFRIPGVYDKEFDE
jgi:hypothetical protein